MDIGLGVVVAADIADLGYTARNEYHQCCIASILRTIFRIKESFLS